MARFVLTLFVGLLPALVQAADKPNIVFVLIDDLGRNDLACYGSKYFRTPNLDRLAAEGMRFTEAYSACPVCSPTRAAIMTGKYPARLNLTDWLPGRPDRPDQKMLRPVINQQLPMEEVTLAQLLKSAGYRTGHIGKWHLGGAGFEPEKRGFDVNVAGDHTGTPLSYFAPYKNNQGRFMPGLEQAPEGEYLTDRLTTEAEKFIESSRDRPFFLYLAHYAVHMPMRARKDVIDKYATNGKPGQQNNPIYAAMIESMDDSVGRILKKLDDLELTKNTLVIFTSDNGGLCTLEGPNTPPTVNSPLREGKGFLYEGGIRVPLLMKWPDRIKAGSVENTPACSIDFLPTLTEVANVANRPKVDGTSLTKLLYGQGGLQRETLYWHYPHYSNQTSRPGAAIRHGNVKLIEFYDSGRRELFDVRKDIGESRNLIEQRPEVARELQAKLDAWRRDVGAKMMKPNPDYVPNPQTKDGVVTMPAKTADVHGIQLRFEPMPHKNTLGFWTNAADWASWEFTIAKPGRFKVEALQGCGKGQGGSEVEFAVDALKLVLKVEDTGGFQNFKALAVGEMRLEKPGRYTLAVKPIKKAASAVMDLREVKLVPVKE